MLLFCIVLGYPACASLPKYFLDCLGYSVPLFTLLLLFFGSSLFGYFLIPCTLGEKIEGGWGGGRVGRRNLSDDYSADRVTSLSITHSCVCERRKFY